MGGGRSPCYTSEWGNCTGARGGGITNTSEIRGEFWIHDRNPPGNQTGARGGVGGGGMVPAAGEPVGEHREEGGQEGRPQRIADHLTTKGTTVKN